MNKWVSETLLPSLFEKYQNRDKRYGEIIVSDNVAKILADVMTQQHTMGCYTAVVTGMECWWNGRHVNLHQRGRYHFVSFGLTAEEQEQVAEKAERRRLEKDLEAAHRAVAIGKTVDRKITRAEADLARQKKMLSECWDDEEREKEYYRAKIAHLEQILDILYGRKAS